MGTDLSFMERAISLAECSRPFAGTNPPVGAVLVREGVVIGEGFHKGPGTPHAEAAALLDARQRAGHTGAVFPGTTLYCTLEPCCHCGNGKRTPPCTEAIIAAGVARVVFACLDPNPCVAGKGAARLREAGRVRRAGTPRGPREGPHRSVFGLHPSPPPLHSPQVGAEPRRPACLPRGSVPLDHQRAGPGIRPPAARHERCGDDRGRHPARR